MRAVSMVVAPTLAVFLVDIHAFAAGNPDRAYYRGAGSCGGAAFRADKAVKTPKPHSSESITLRGVLPV